MPKNTPEKSLASKTLSHIKHELAGIPFRALGFTAGYEDVSPFATAAIGHKVWKYTRRHHPVIVGSLPETGAAILAGNHFDGDADHEGGDSYKTFLAGWEVGRITTRVIVKASLVDPNGFESAEFLASLGNKEGEFSKYNRVKAWAMRSAGVIPHRRDMPPTRDLRRTADRVLDLGGLLGAFLMMTRDPQGYLHDLQTGAAFFAKKHPDTLVVPMSFSGPPNGEDKLVIHPGFTFNEKNNQTKQRLGRGITVGEFLLEIGDAVSIGLPEPQRVAWGTQREIERTRLTATRRSAVPA